MNIYIIYKFSEYECISQHINKFTNDNPEDKVFYFTPHNKESQTNWKEIAKAKIADSDIIIYIRLDISDEYTEKALENISYELSLAQQYQKNIIVNEIPTDKNSSKKSNIGFPSIIYEKDFLDNKCLKYNVINCLDKKNIQATLFDMNKRLFKNTNVCDDAFSNILLNEYKIMLDTSEKMMDRRQGTNNFYITLCTAMLTVMVAFVATRTNTFAWCGVTFIISGMMIFICHNWMKTLEAYGLSNRAKYEVLNKIEEKLPASIFASEWEYGKTLNYSSYSTRESKIPVIFIFLFLLLMLAMITVFILTIQNIIPQYLFNK